MEVFAGWTDKAYIVSQGSQASSTRVRSAAFTPTNGKSYRIAEWLNNGTGTTTIYNAKIIIDQTSPTLLEPQYLIANTKLAAGTSLQNFLTSWTSTEWSNDTNTYTHQVDSGAGSSVIEADTLVVHRSSDHL